MIIEKIEPVPTQERMLRLRLSDGTTLKTQDYVVAELGLCTGMELDEAGMARLLEAVGTASAKARALRIVSASGVSKEELYHRLTQKGETAAHAEQAVDWLSELSLLDDRKTAEQIVRSAAAKGYGAARIRQILYEKRIPREYWEEALEALPEMDPAVDLFLQRRLKGRDPDEKELKRTIDALLRRGHSWQDIRAGLQRYSSALDMEMEEPYE